MQNKPSKSKAECDIEGNTPYDCRDIESSPYSDPCETGRDDAETLRALQFALAPLDRAMRDTGLESWQRQLMHRTVESEEDYNQRMDEREQDRHDMQEAE